MILLTRIFTVVALLFSLGCSEEASDAVNSAPQTQTIEHKLILYTSCIDACADYELFQFDIEEQTTEVVGEGVFANVSTFIVVGDKAYLSASDGANGTELWVYDPSLPEQSGVNPQLVKDIDPGVGSSNPVRFAEIGGKIYFRARTSAEGAEPWVLDPSQPIVDGQNPKMIADIEAGSTGSEPHYFTEYNGKNIFCCDNKF